MRRICYVVSIPETIRAFFIPQLEYLEEQGYSVSVICSPDDAMQKQLGRRISFLPVEIPRGISIKGSIKAIRQLILIFSKEKFDLIQYSTPNAALYASIAAKMTGCRVRNYHLMGYRYLGASGLGRTILKWIEKIACRNSTSIECVSKSNLEIGVNERIFEKKKATVVWNGSTGGVDLERFDVGKRFEYRKEIRGKFGLSDDDFVYGFVGRITRDKGINETLEAFSKIEAAKLLMIGNVEGTGTLKQELYRQSLQNPNIIYTGSVIDTEKYYAALDVLLLPSYREGFGNVVIEAAAMGTPAIVSDIPGPVDAIQNGVTALVVEPKSSQSLLDGMKKIRCLDYAKMGMDAHRFVSANFDSAELCKRILLRKQQLLGG